MGSSGNHWLDTTLARWIALSVCIIATTIAIFIHNSFLPTQNSLPKEAVNKHYVACITNRGSEIDAMLREGMVDQQQAALFRSRASSFCYAKFPPTNP